MSDSEKKARLAEALRANLRKRKAQSRAQAARDAEVPVCGDQRDCTHSDAD
jgi:hypothetical protein